MPRIVNVVKVIVALVVAVLYVASLSHAQSQTRPSFEVASVKPNPSSDGGLTVRLANPSSRFAMERASARDIIEFAYNLQDRRLSGGPKWIDSEKFDVMAQIADSEIAELQKLSPDQFLANVRLMVQSLLADRFALKLSHETKELPVYVLTIGKDGSKLKPATSAQPSMRNVGVGHFVATAIPIGVLVDELAGLPELDDRLVVDRTALSGSFDIDLQWTPQILTSPSTANAGQNQNPMSADTSTPSLVEALQRQLGLRLESTKAPVDIQIIDHIEEPSPN
jgi:uncharacterized protein (TIGR03435 family)